ncbi:MAG TPA: sterol desaturase family protein [Kofleriaceae bacterium]|nr:sterol desaturase family protein [Kofleriaceae bacterium]
MPPLKFWIMYFGLGLIATVLELVRPSRKLNYWAGDALALDIASFFFYQFVVVYWAGVLRSYIPLQFKATKVMTEFPLWLRVAAYYVVGDFSGYWMHRLTHTKYVWRVHHFHHSTTQMYWLAGVRCTIWQQTLSNLPYILWAPLVFDAPREVFTGLLFMNILTNHWMHMNFTWRSNWLEYVLVTPRSHHIHHSASPEHYNKNFGVVFSIWDRMFRTWLDPDKTKVTEVGAADLRNPAQAVWLGFGVFGTEPNDFVRSRLRRVMPFL